MNESSDIQAIRLDEHEGVDVEAVVPAAVVVGVSSSPEFCHCYATSASGQGVVVVVGGGGGGGGGGVTRILPAAKRLYKYSNT